MLSQIEELGFRVERVSYTRGGQVVFGWLHGLVGRFPWSSRSIRRHPPQRGPPGDGLGSGGRLDALAAGVVALPVALVGSAIEVAARSGGTIYVEVRREPKAS